MQIKITLRYHFIFNKGAKIKKIKKTVTSVSKNAEKLDHSYITSGM